MCFKVLVKSPSQRKPSRQLVQLLKFRRGHRCLNLKIDHLEKFIANKPAGGDSPSDALQAAYAEMQNEFASLSIDIATMPFASPGFVAINAASASPSEAVFFRFTVEDESCFARLTADAEDSYH